MTDARQDPQSIAKTPKSCGNVPVGTNSLQWTLLVLGALGSAAFLDYVRYSAAVSIGSNYSFSLGYLVGQAVGLLGIPVLLSFLFTKSRRFPVRFIGLCCMVLLLWYGLHEKAKPAVEFMSEVNRFRSVVTKDAKEQLQSNIGFQPDLAKAEDHLAALGQKSQNFDGETVNMAEALLTVNWKLLSLSKNYQSAVSRYVGAGGIEATTIHTLEQLDSREAIVRELRQANERVLEFLRHIDTHLNTALEVTGVTMEQRHAAIAEYKEGAKIDLVSTVRELDSDIAIDSLAALSLLRREWGKWVITDKKLLFERDSAAVEFDEFQRRIQVAGQKQRLVQQRFFGVPDTD